MCSLEYIEKMSLEPLVRWVGAQRDVLRGDIDGRIALGDLRAIPHLYALGPLARIRGEVTVFDGTPSIARVVDGRVIVDGSADVHACFLVYASVPAWTAAVVSTPLNDAHDLEPLVRAAATTQGLEGDIPVPFRVRGTARATTCHVLDKRDTSPHTPERHEAAKFRFTIRAAPIEAIGFHSEGHRGVFTPGDSNLHVHLRTTDGRWSGHMEELALAAPWILGVPLRMPAGGIRDA